MGVRDSASERTAGSPSGEGVAGPHRRVAMRVARVVVADPSAEAAVSGLYSWRGSVTALAVVVGNSWPAPPLPTSPSAGAGPFDASAELRLDVDGRYPQMLASGVVRGSPTWRTD